MSAPEKQALLACPFCGVGPYVSKGVAYCNTCDIRMGNDHWNRRDGLLPALRAVRDRCLGFTAGGNAIDSFLVELRKSLDDTALLELAGVGQHRDRTSDGLRSMTDERLVSGQLSKESAEQVPAPASSQKYERWPVGEPKDYREGSTIAPPSGDPRVFPGLAAPASSWCSQCGQDLSARACGPTHALRANELAGVVAGSAGREPGRATPAHDEKPLNTGLLAQEDPGAGWRAGSESEQCSTGTGKPSAPASSSPTEEKRRLDEHLDWHRRVGDPTMDPDGVWESANPQMRQAAYAAQGKQSWRYQNFKPPEVQAAEPADRPDPQDLLRALHKAIYGGSWARPDSPHIVWEELIEKVKDWRRAVGNIQAESLVLLDAARDLREWASKSPSLVHKAWTGEEVTVVYMAADRLEARAKELSG